MAAVYRTLYEFLSTPSARRATNHLRRASARAGISIHALCEEGDYETAAVYSEIFNFYPRPLRGGRLAALWRPAADARDFYPRPLRGGRQLSSALLVTSALFLSTPSARRATTDFFALVTSF